jgi:phage terminase large subunit-like protein
MEENNKYYFDNTSATIAVNFFEKILKHSIGEWAGKPFMLLDWQKEKIIKPIFGWKSVETGLRKYRTVYIEVGRKQGKSELGAAIALLLLLMDNEPGAEIYSAAADRNQAGIVFTQAKNMLENSGELSKLVEIYKNTITVPSTRSFYRVLSSDAPTKHGLNAHGIIFDELHAQPNRELWDVLTTSTGSRRQPLIVALTTAGYDRESICWEVHDYAKKVEAGIISDDSFLPVIYSADEKDDWLDEETWKKSNPSLGVTIKLDYLRGEAERAKNIPAYQNTFRRLHLSQWVQQESRWLDMTAWDACNTEINPKQLEGMLCYGGLDLASTSDIAAFSLVFPNIQDSDEMYLFYHFSDTRRWVNREVKKR